MRAALLCNGIRVTILFFRCETVLEMLSRCQILDPRYKDVSLSRARSIDQIEAKMVMNESGIERSATVSTVEANNKSGKCVTLFRF